MPFSIVIGLDQTDPFPSMFKNRQYVQFSAYGFLKNLRFFDAFLILFFLEKGLSYTEIGGLYAVREIMVNVLEIPSGIVADTFGRKSSLLLSFVLYLVSFGLFYLAGSYWIFLMAMLMYGIGDAFRSGTHKGMIMEYLKSQGWSDEKVNYYGHTRAWSQRGSAISALVAGLLVFYDGTYERIFLYSMIPYFLNLINVWSYPAYLSRTKKSGRVMVSLKETFVGYWEVVKNRRLLRVIHSAAIHSAFMRSVKDYIQPLLVNVAMLLPVFLDEDPTKKSGLVIGFVYFLIFQLSSYASRNAVRAARLKGVKIDQLTLLVGFGAGLLVGICYESALWVWALVPFVLIYLIENIRKPILTGSVADQVPGEILTSVLSTQSFWKTLLTAGLSLLIGVLVDGLGVGIGLATVSGMLLIGGVVISFYTSVFWGKK